MQLSIHAIDLSSLTAVTLLAQAQAIALDGVNASFNTVAASNLTADQYAEALATAVDGAAIVVQGYPVSATASGSVLYVMMVESDGSPGPVVIDGLPAVSTAANWQSSVIEANYTDPTIGMVTPAQANGQAILAAGAGAALARIFA